MNEWKWRESELVKEYKKKVAMAGDVGTMMKCGDNGNAKNYSVKNNVIEFERICFSFTFQVGIFDVFIFLWNFKFESCYDVLL